MNDRVGPLKGIRVLDLTQALAGPYCTMLLADLGAYVVKVESSRGEMTRFSGPFTDDDTERAFGGYYASLNRNKRSLVLDLKSPGGKEAVLRLAGKSDVLVENFAAGVMERLGLAYETLVKRNPRLVYAAIRGFGDPRTGASPYTDWPAYDIVAQAMGGLVGVTGTPEAGGLRCGPSVGDIMPGTLAAVGILSAVLHARETGEGQFLDVAMYDAVLSLCEHYVYLYSYGGENPGPIGNAHPFLCPFDIFEDPHTAAREMLPEIDQVGAPPVKLAGQPIKLTRTPSRIYRRAPVLGEHNDEILAEIGMSQADLAASE